MNWIEATDKNRFTLVTIITGLLAFLNRLAGSAAARVWPVTMGKNTAQARGGCLPWRFIYTSSSPISKKGDDMLRLTILILACLATGTPAAGERVSATNFYVVKQERFNAGNRIFWMEDNTGSFTVSEGPIEPGFARCIGTGFGGASGVTGGGICIYGEGENTFTMEWKVEPDGDNSWKVVDGSGRYRGMTGSGTTRTRVNSNFLKLPHRISDWEGEVELPDRD